MSNQGKRQESVRAVTGTAYSYEGDWHALFSAAGIPNGTFNERLLPWINAQLSTSYVEINGAMNAFALSNGVASWNELGLFTIGGGGGGGGGVGDLNWGADGLLWGAANNIMWGL